MYVLERRDRMHLVTNLMVRLGALAASLGGLMWAAKAIYDRNDAPPWPTDATDTLFFLSPLLFLLALMGLYARCRGRLRKWEALSSAAVAGAVIGSVGSTLGGLSTALEVGPPSWWAEISWWMFVFGFFLVHLCLLFLGNSILQTGAFPRWGTLPLLIGSLGILLILVGDPPNSPLGVYPALALWITYGLAWMALGYVLWSSRDAPARRTAPVR
jgi:hypothetical protein